MNQIFKISLIILGIALFYVVKSYMVDKFSSTETFFTTEHNKSANSHFQNYAKESGFYVKAETFNKNETDLQNQSELNFREENNIKEEKEVEKISPYDIIYDHLSDKYSWELIGLPIKPLTVYLPVIVGKDFKSLEIFSSKKLQGDEKYHGYFIAREGDYKNKVVYIDESGAEKRPIDISFTKDACALVISSLVMFLVLFSLKRFYKKKPLGVPRGFRGMLESLTMMIVDEVLKPCLRDDYKRYAPYLLTVFYFILTINLLGLIVIFPGGVNLSGNI